MMEWPRSIGMRYARVARTKPKTSAPRGARTEYYNSAASFGLCRVNICAHSCSCMMTDSAPTPNPISPPVREPIDLSRLKLGIVCPMANEEALAEKFVNELLDVCNSAGFALVEMFVVLDKASKDNTLPLLRKLEKQRPQLNVIWAPENRSVVDAYIRGYGEAIKAGCDWILEIDAGYSHQPADVPQFFAAMAEGRDCVFGSRFCDGGSLEGPLKRRIVSRGGTVLAN